MRGATGAPGNQNNPVLAQVKTLLVTGEPEWGGGTGFRYPGCLDFGQTGEVRLLIRSLL